MTIYGVAVQPTRPLPWNNEEGLLVDLDMESLSPWSELFPNGRTIFYEGDDPEGFCKEIKAEFGFDPRERPGDFTIPGHAPSPMTWEQHRAFHCPPEHLDAIYASGRWPMGS